MCESRCATSTPYTTTPRSIARTRRRSACSSRTVAHLRRTPTGGADLRVLRARPIKKAIAASATAALSAPITEEGACQRPRASPSGRSEGSNKSTAVVVTRQEGIRQLRFPSTAIPRASALSLCVEQQEAALGIARRTRRRLRKHVLAVGPADRHAPSSAPRACFSLGFGTCFPGLGQER